MTNKIKYRPKIFLDAAKLLFPCDKVFLCCDAIGAITNNIDKSYSSNEKDLFYNYFQLIYSEVKKVYPDREMFLGFWPMVKSYNKIWGGDFIVRKEYLEPRIIALLLLVEISKDLNNERG